MICSRFIFLQLFLLLFLSSPILAKTIVVCGTCEYQTLQGGIDAATDGDKVVLEEGVYHEYDIYIKNSIQIIAKGKAIIDGKNKGSIFQVSADSVTIDGLHIRNVGQSYIKDFAAIRVHRARHFTARNNTLENVFFGILIEKSHYCLIEDNHISSHAIEESSSGNGIHGWHSSHLVVRNNVVHEMRDGIYFEFVTESKISNNESYNNIRYGLHFMFSNHDEYFDNTFTNNGAGVAVMFSKFINMKRNKFLDNWGASSYGLLLKEIYDAEIEDNLFKRNTTGVTLEGSTRINYKGNKFINNGWAIKVTGACYKNIFKGNNFIGNSFDMSYNGQINDNVFESNYWSNYAGYDLDKDGIGDVPFRPVKLFSYVVNKTPETIVLLRSLFVDIINFSEKVSPVFTPDNLMDAKPLMNPI